MVSEPVPAGLESVMVSSSLFSTVQPAGTVTEKPAFETTLALVGVGLGEPKTGEGIGDGDPAGVGLGSPCWMFAVGVLFWLPIREARTAIPVPRAAMITISATTAAMMIIHGARWTGAPPAGAAM